MAGLPIRIVTVGRHPSDSSRQDDCPGCSRRTEPRNGRFDASEPQDGPTATRPALPSSWGNLRIDNCVGRVRGQHVGQRRHPGQLQALGPDCSGQSGPHGNQLLQFAPNVTTGVTTDGRLSRIPWGFCSLFYPSRGSLSFFYGRSSKRLTPDDERSTPGVFRFCPTFWAF
jgi:hypothetical protein